MARHLRDIRRDAQLLDGLADQVPSHLRLDDYRDVRRGVGIPRPFHGFIGANKAERHVNFLEFAFLEAENWIAANKFGNGCTPKKMLIIVEHAPGVFGGCQDKVRLRQIGDPDTDRFYYGVGYLHSPMNLVHIVHGMVMNYVYLPQLNGEPTGYACLYFLRFQDRRIALDLKQIRAEVDIVLTSDVQCLSELYMARVNDANLLIRSNNPFFTPLLSDNSDGFCFQCGRRRQPYQKTPCTTPDCHTSLWSNPPEHCFPRFSENPAQCPFEQNIGTIQDIIERGVHNDRGALSARLTENIMLVLEDPKDGRSRWSRNTRDGRTPVAIKHMIKDSTLSVRRPVVMKRDALGQAETTHPCDAVIFVPYTIHNQVNTTSPPALRWMDPYINNRMTHGNPNGINVRAVSERNVTALVWMAQVAATMNMGDAPQLGSEQKCIVCNTSTARAGPNVNHCNNQDCCMEMIPDGYRDLNRYRKHPAFGVISAPPPFNPTLGNARFQVAGQPMGVPAMPMRGNWDV